MVEVDAAIIGYADAMKNQDKWLVLLPIPEGKSRRNCDISGIKNFNKSHTSTTIG